MENKELAHEARGKEGLAYPRITVDDIEADIVCEYFFTAGEALEPYLVRDTRDFSSDPGRQSIVDTFNAQADADRLALSSLTFCVLILRSGLAVTGDSACASLESFNAETGRARARQKAIDKIHSLKGYELARHDERTTFTFPESATQEDIGKFLRMWNEMVDAAASGVQRRVQLHHPV